MSKIFVLLIVSVLITGCLGEDSAKSSEKVLDDNAGILSAEKTERSE